METMQRASLDQQTAASQPRRLTLAIICPVFNEESAIPLFFERMQAATDRLREHYETRVYFVDNGSSDASQAIIRRLAASHPGVFLIVLSRNFGYQCALDCGLRTAIGDLYAMIDVDCEDPPELITRFVAEYEQGHDIVYGERLERPEPYYLKGLRKAYYRLVRAVADENFVLNMAEFSLMTAEVRNAIIDEVNSFPFIRASIGRIGFRRKNVPYAREKRCAGETHYNLVGMTIFGIAGIMSASTVALRWPAYLFAPWLAVLIVLCVWAVISPGAWQIPMMVLLVGAFGGFCCVTIGLYVARIYKNTLRRPNGIIRWHLSLLPVDEGSEKTGRSGQPVDACSPLRAERTTVSPRHADR